MADILHLLYLLKLFNASNHPGDILASLSVHLHELIQADVLIALQSPSNYEPDSRY